MSCQPVVLFISTVPVFHDHYDVTHKYVWHKWCGSLKVDNKIIAERVIGRKQPRQIQVLWLITDNCHAPSDWIQGVTQVQYHTTSVVPLAFLLPNINSPDLSNPRSTDWLKTVCNSQTSYIYITSERNSTAKTDPVNYPDNKMKTSGLQFSIEQQQPLPHALWPA